MSAQVGAGWCDEHRQAYSLDGTCWACSDEGTVIDIDARGRVSRRPAGGASLLPGERVLHRTTRHWITVAPKVVLCAALAVIGLVVVVETPDVAGGRDIVDAKLIAALGLVLILGTVAAVVWVRWKRETYTLTSRRLVAAKGLLVRSTDSILLERIQDVSLRRTAWLGYGDLVVLTAGFGELALRRIAGANAFEHALLVQMTLAGRGRR